MVNSRKNSREILCDTEYRPSYYQKEEKFVGDEVILDCEFADFIRNKEPVTQVIAIAILDLTGKIVLSKIIQPDGILTKCHSAIHGINPDFIYWAGWKWWSIKPIIEKALNNKIIYGWAPDNDMTVFFFFPFPRELG